jgi:phosphoribosylaminoimidazole carboxylase (NCAIR synthetase)
MKNIHRSQLAWAAFALALAAGSLVAQDGDASARKPMLLAEALKARDEGNLQTAKEKFEAILAIDPKDMGANEGLTSVNAALAEATAAEARALALSIAGQIGLVGLLAVEMFVQDGRIVVNELAPRPHNSGHQTFDANETSQFEQHVRAVCGLPLGGTKPLAPSAMVNLLGDVWRDGQEPDWTKVLADPSAKLHLYDKGKAAPGRKMGHITVTAPTLEEALRRAEALHASL